MVKLMVNHILLHLISFFPEHKMGIKDFQNFIEKDPTLSKVGVNGIDLVKTAWKMNKGKGQVSQE